jgi:UDP-N-acetylmuramate--alanine ligase
MTHVHLIGIGGTGLSAIARVLLERGYVVSGSDRALSPQAKELAEAGVGVMTGHQAENVRGADVVVRSSAVPDDNVEVRAAQAAGVPVLKRAQFLGELMRGQRVIAVAGTHGKTSTSAMIAWALTHLNQDPSYIVGGTVRNLNSNAHAGQGGAFVIEADEYDRMFLGLDPDVAVVTYLEHDHPDCFPSMADYRAAFTAFLGRIKPGGVLLVCHDTDETRGLLPAAPEGTTALTYGLSAGADYRAVNVHPNALGGFDYAVEYQRLTAAPVLLGSVHLQVPGEHNVRNSLAALAVLHQFVPGSASLLPAIAQALGEFSGAGRRFDVQGEVQGITVIDDYAHHPTEIQATLAAARARYPLRRIWAVWQPHTFSRTLSLLAAFAASFRDADRVLVTEVYAAREKAKDFDNFSAAQVVERMNHPGAQFSATLDETTHRLLQQLQPGDVLLVLSAGDADQISARVLAALQTGSDSADRLSLQQEGK